MLPSSPANNNGILINQSTVFLGGSCNPTTWRKDIAIPMLKALNITYYDPQKDHWEPELIELEDKAKKNAEVLFFVIDNQTRSIASMIEVSFIAATTKKLVLVIDLFPSLEPIINGEPISQYEHDILKGGRKLLMKLVERKGMPVFNQIPAALNYIPIMIARNAKSRDINHLPQFKGTDDRQLSALHVLTSLLSSYELIKLKEVYDSCAESAGCLSLLDTKLAYLMLTGKELDDLSVQNLLQLETSDDNITKENYSSNQFHHYNHQNLHLNHNHTHQQSNLFTSRHLHPNLNRSVEQNLYPHHYQINHNHHHHHHHHHQYLQTNQKHLNHHNSQPNAHHHLHHHLHHHHHHNNISNESYVLPINSSTTINFKQFCSLILDYLKTTAADGSGSPFVNLSSSHTPPTSPSVNLLTSLVNLPQLDNCDCDYNQKQEDLNGNSCKESFYNSTDSQRTTKGKDIYLAGSDNPKGWRTSLAIPLIDQSNLTYSMPKVNSSIDWTTMGNDLRSLESCRVLLFVIGGQTPELETMILASHYFGLKFKVVLCIQPIPLESIAQDNQISMAAINDYNRGRAYLSEMARKENIEVFEDLEEAVKCAIRAAKS